MKEFLKQNVKKIVTVAVLLFVFFLLACSFQQHALTLSDGENTKKIKMTFWDTYKLEEPNKEFYTFEGWFDSAGNKRNEICFLTKNSRVVAKYTPNSYKIEYYDGEEKL